MGKIVNIPKYESFQRGDKIWQSLSAVDKARVKSGDTWYILLENIRYHSKRYNKWVFINKGYISDGATGAMDIHSLGWWVHDKLCETYQWRDGTECTRKMGSQVLSDILKAEGRWARSWYWKHVTYYPHKWGWL